MTEVFVEISALLRYVVIIWLLSCCVVTDEYHDYFALSIIVPIVLVCAIVFLTVCIVVAYSLRARRRRAALYHARLYGQHQAALHAAGHFDDTLPHG